MPRLPVLIEQSNQCQGEETQEYAAYTDGVGYVFRITSKIDPPNYCSQKRNFDEKNFANRVQVLKNDLIEVSKSEDNNSKNEVIKLTANDRIIKLINDFENKRWFELKIIGDDEKKIEVKNFLSSLKTKKTATGIEIGQGAEQTYGDDASASIVEVKTTTNSGIGNGANSEKIDTVKQILVKINDLTNKVLTIVSKPRANYTDSARQSTIQGKVVLRVTFLANGAIGNISPVSGLGNGLTEEAIKAARKIVFVPAQGKGFRVSVAKIIEYSFTIY
ncbi:MAG: TonB family protein [Actinomycetota bacterium]